jgi:hypothetical protein
LQVARQNATFRLGHIWGASVAAAGLSARGLALKDGVERPLAAAAGPDGVNRADGNKDINPTLSLSIARPVGMAPPTRRLFRADLVPQTRGRDYQRR